MKKNLAAIGASLIIFSLTSCFNAKSKEFNNDSIHITLTNEFKVQKSNDGLLYLISKEIIFIGNQEKNTDIGELSLKEYTDLVLKNASEKVKITSEVKEYTDDSTYFMDVNYIEENEKNSYNYLVTTFKSQSYYYACNFITKLDKYEELESQLLDYAKTIKVK